MNHPIAQIRQSCYTEILTFLLVIAMRTILLITDVESTAFKSIAEHVARLAHDQDWALHVVVTSRRDRKKSEQMVRAWHPDGCLVYCAPPHGVPVGLDRLPCPCVFLNPSEDLQNSVRHDSAATGRLAAGELMRLGLDSFAFVGPNTPFAWSIARLHGFTEALLACGRTPAVYPGRSLETWLKNLPRPCGLFAANDALAEKVVVAALSAGLAIPSDVTILGVDDDTRVCENAEVSLSSIRPDFAACARLAVSALAAQMEQPCTQTRTLVYGDEGIIHRASTRLLRGHTPALAAALEFIRRNALFGITPEDLLRRMKGSRRSIETSFRAAVGHSILDEIHAIRLAEAKRLLANPALPIASITAQVGYTSQNFLARLFKRTYGMTMREYRASATTAS